MLGAGAAPGVVAGFWAGVLDAVTGPLAALGAVCLGLVVLSPARTESTAGRPPVTAVLRAALVRLGRRSLPVYLAHSVLLALVLAPWALGAGSRWGSAQVSALAVLLWVGSVGVALLAGRVPPAASAGSAVRSGPAP